MARVIEMINISNMVIPVTLKNGVTVYVQPRGRVVNEEVHNLEEVRKFFKVTEQLNETPAPTPPHVPRRKKATTEDGK